MSVALITQNVLTAPAFAVTATSGSAGSALMQAFLRLFLFAAILIACVVLIRVFAKKRGVKMGGRLSVIESAFVANGVSVSIIRVGGQYFLISAGKDGARLISELDAGAFAAENAETGETRPITVMDYLRGLTTGAKKENRYNDKDD